MQVVIPSMGRAGKVRPLPWMPRDVIIVTPRSERATYAEAYPDVTVIGAPNSIRGIAPTRQWIVDNMKDDIVFMVDDDLIFFQRDPATLKLTRLEDPAPMWRAVEESFHQGFPHVAISIRLGNNRVPTPYKDDTNVCDLWGVDRRILRKHNIRIDRTPVMEDYQTILSLLTLGYHTRVHFQWAANGANARNAAGGCSTWRTAEVQAKGANMLKAMFPEFVTVVHKTTKDGWFNGERVDVRIAWKKASESGQIFR